MRQPWSKSWSLTAFDQLLDQGCLNERGPYFVASVLELRVLRWVPRVARGGGVDDPEVRAYLAADLGVEVSSLPLDGVEPRLSPDEAACVLQLEAEEAQRRTSWPLSREAESRILEFDGAEPPSPGSATPSDPLELFWAFGQATGGNARWYLEGANRADEATSQVYVLEGEYGDCEPHTPIDAAPGTHESCTGLRVECDPAGCRVWLPPTPTASRRGNAGRGVPKGP